MPPHSHPPRLPRLPDPQTNKAYYLNLQHKLDPNQELPYADLVILVQKGREADQEQLEEAHHYEERKKDLESHIRGIALVANKKNHDDVAALEVWKERYTEVFPNSSRSGFAFRRIKLDLETASSRVSQDREPMTFYPNEVVGYEVKSEFEPKTEGESSWWRFEISTRVTKLDLLAETYFNSRGILSQPDSKAIKHANQYFEGLNEILADKSRFEGWSEEPGRRWWLKLDRELRVIEHLFAPHDAFHIFTKNSIPALYRLDHVRSRIASSPESPALAGEGRSVQQSLSKFSPIARSRFGRI